MVADKRLEAIARCVGDPHVRRELAYVYIKGNKAVGTNGRIIARAQFAEFSDREYPGYAPELEPADGALVDPDAIISAFRAAPKKTKRPIERCIQIVRSGPAVIIRHLLKDLTIVTDTCSQPNLTYPDIDKVWLDARPEFKVRISANLLAKVVDLARTGTADPYRPVRFYFAASPRAGKPSMIQFEVCDDGRLTIDGGLMPMSPGEKEC